MTTLELKTVRQRAPLQPSIGITHGREGSDVAQLAPPVRSQGSKMLTTGMKMFLGVAILTVASSIAFFLSDDVAIAYSYVAVTAALLPISLLVVRFRDFESGAAPEQTAETVPEPQVPRPSIWPPGVAIGVGVATVGFVVDGFLAIYGLLLVLVAAAGWLTATRALDIAWRSGERVDPEQPRPTRIINRLQTASRALSIAGIVLGAVLMFVGLSRSRVGESILGFIVLGAVVTTQSASFSPARSRASRTDSAH